MIPDYRGRNLDGNWVFGSYVDINNLPYGIIIYRDISVSDVNTYKEEDPLSLGESDFTLVERKTVGLFTGRFDKNGKKIYEGDILRCVSHTKINVEFTQIVIWDPNNSRFDPFSEEGDGDFDYFVTETLYD